MSRTLADQYRRFAAGASALEERVALGLSGSAPALKIIAAAPRRSPTAILAALHDRVLAGRAPQLEAAYAAGQGEAAAAVDTLLTMGDEVVAVAARWPVRTGETGRYSVLYPAIAEAARRADAQAVGLIEVGCSVGFNLNVDRVGITYGNGQILGEKSSAVQVTCGIRGSRPLPDQAIPEVVTRIGIDPDPVDLTDSDQVRWLRAGIPPDRPDQDARLRAEIALSTPEVQLLRGDPLELLPDAFARVPPNAVPIVLTSWALSSFSLERRLRFLQCLDRAALNRPVAWVSAEGVGVAPAVPTLGDRPASGHSIIGLAGFGPSGMSAEAVGRCWSRGQLLMWLNP